MTISAWLIFLGIIVIFTGVVLWAVQVLQQQFRLTPSSLTAIRVLIVLFALLWILQKAAPQFGYG